MMKIIKITIASFLAIVLITGCSTKNEYDGRSYKTIKTIVKGLVIRSRVVTISDDGKGTSIGAMVGGSLGSVVGSRSGNYFGGALGSIGGAITGGVAGSEVGKREGTELSVDLESGESVVIVVERTDIVAGDRIEIIKNGNKVERVNIIE